MFKIFTKPDINICEETYPLILDATTFQYLIILVGQKDPTSLIV